MLRGESVRAREVIRVSDHMGRGSRGSINSYGIVRVVGGGSYLNSLHTFMRYTYLLSTAKINLIYFVDLIQF